MIVELLRETIQNALGNEDASGDKVTLCKIAIKADVNKAALSRIMNGGGCKAQTADKVFEYLGFEVLVRPKRKAR
ncbi:hypothetical protein ACFL6U_23880 [Planctomycetota bacterium]